MSVRAIWIVSLFKEDYGRVSYYRHFPTVEKKCKVMNRVNYVPLPSAVSVANNLLVTLGFTDSKQFVEWSDKCNGVMQLPVVELSINSQSLWPVIAIAQNSFLVCCLPFDEGGIKNEKLLKVPYISMGFSVLLGILNIIGVTSKSDRMIDLDNLLTLSMPFGSPSDVDLSCVATQLKFPTQKFLKKQPAWKPFEYRAKQVINIKIMEYVRCILGEERIHFQTFGQVSVKAEIEGNDVSLTLGSVDSVLSLQSLVIHPCVSISGASSLGVQKRLRFSPPLHEFVLFHYVSSIPKEPPLQGIFKMIGEDSVEFLLQLKLNEKVKNSFDFCDLVIVFFNKGPVKRMEINANYGSLKLSEDKYSLKWTIGSKFPKDLEIKLTAKIEFNEGPLMHDSDPFCIEKNCYVQMNWKQSNNTLSGFNIDPKSVTLSEGTKPKIYMERSVQSTEYRIWNSYGDLPFPLQADKIFQQICTK